MALQRLDNVAVVVDDLDAAVAFFAELGMELEGRTTIEGRWAERVVGLDGLRSEIAMMRVSDGPGRLELTRYHAPTPLDLGLGTAPPNVLGLHRVMFAVDDIDDTVERLGSHGGEVLGEIVRYEDAYRLCYLRGPGGIIVGIAQQLG
ncbi:VOC family protein [Cellulosimicrobium protaetiae]|uniref:VOC family protein n=1 Tax=Cellulosimicrobium protaetiae TaxID=2587808 RepID=A0A6M5UHB6_9MICO|nr:VOC family protein [Cellulosimicrobium protaetiae]QJW36573.1 VOC family protein [Cellulosimicrobium protaetiae]